MTWLVAVLVASYPCLVVALLGLVWNERWRDYKAGAEHAMAVDDPTPDLPEREWKPGDSPLLPPLPDHAYPPDAEPLEPPVVDPEPTLREKLILAGLGPLNPQHTCGPHCTPPTGPVLQDRWRVHTACFDAYADRLPARVCPVCAPVLLGVRHG